MQSQSVSCEIVVKCRQDGEVNATVSSFTILCNLFQPTYSDNSIIQNDANKPYQKLLVFLVSLVRRMKLIYLVHDVMYCTMYCNLHTNTAARKLIDFQNRMVSYFYHLQDLKKLWLIIIHSPSIMYYNNGQ